MHNKFEKNQELTENRTNPAKITFKPAKLLFQPKSKHKQMWNATPLWLVRCHVLRPHIL
jgi:hypothetical protein